MRLREKFYTSYKTHNFCCRCDNGNKTGWILKTDCLGDGNNICPKCKIRLRTKPKWNKGSPEAGRY